MHVYNVIRLVCVSAKYPCLESCTSTVFVVAESEMNINRIIPLSLSVAVFGQMSGVSVALQNLVRFE